MKDIIKFVVVFGVVYALWMVFWRSVFTAWDLFGLVGVVLLLGIIWNVGRKYLGTSHSPNIVQMPPTQAARQSASHEKAGSGPTTSPRADTFSLPQTDDYVTLVAKVHGLESRCSEVWQRSLGQRRNYRKLRHESGAAAKHLVEIEQETAVPDETLVRDIDAFLDGLCAVYLGANSELRQEIRALMESNVSLLGNVYNYSGRAAVELKRTGRPVFLLRGLIAVSIDDNSSHRDHEWILGDLYLAAVHWRVEPAPYFKFVAGLSSTEPDGIRATIEDFQRTGHYRTYVLSRLGGQK